jgi:hypothetical protein
MRRRYSFSSFDAPIKILTLLIVSRPCIAWLRVPAERIKFKIAVLMYRVLQGAIYTPQHLRQFVRVADFPSRQRLRPAVTDRLIVPAFRLSTIGCRSFLVAGANIWNSLPWDVTSSSSLSVFKQRLKTYLFRFPFPDLSF